MRRAALAAGALSAAAVAASAQDAAPPSVVPAPTAETATDAPLRRSPVLVIRRDALFENSAFGKAARARFEAASQALIAENRELEKALEAEERALTERRASLPAADFRAEADAFDAKVEGIRNARDAKSREITRGFEEDRQRFLAAAIPVLARIMAEYGAAVILDQQTVVVNLDAVDVTELAVKMIDAAIGEGSPPAAAAGDAAPPADGGAPAAPAPAPPVNPGP